MIGSQPQTASGSDVQPRSGFHLDYLDGLRGFTALWVLCFHVAYKFLVLPDLYAVRGMHRLFWLLPVSGHQAVAVFIVLSGYCLMLPVVKQPGGKLRGGPFGYLLRRAKRILPPYYAALALALLLNALIPGMNAGLGQEAGHYPSLTEGAIVSHVFLFHNLSRDWFFKIDGPMWSVATEWQIYFLMPLAFLPAFRRFGVFGLLTTGIVIPAAVHQLFHHRYDLVCLQYIFLFALGMAAANIGYAETVFWKDWKSRRRSLIVVGTGVSLISLISLAHYAGFDLSSGVSTALLDVLFGFIIAFLLVDIAERGNDHPVRRLLSSRSLVVVGTFSYSLYLIHDPLLFAMQTTLIRSHVGSFFADAIMVAMIPICTVIAYAFHRMAERPFMPHHPRTERQAELVAAVSPAP